MKQFEDAAKEIFSKAGVDVESNQDLFDECKSILAQSMATLSVSMGMSMKRVSAYDGQKQALVDDLIKLKESGQLK